MQHSRYSPKKAAMVLIDNWLTIGGSSPHWKDEDEMENDLVDYDWKINEQRRIDILAQVDKIIGPLQQRVSQYVEKI